MIKFIFKLCFCFVIFLSLNTDLQSFSVKSFCCLSPMSFVKFKAVKSKPFPKSPSMLEMEEKEKTRLQIVDKLNTFTEENFESTVQTICDLIANIYLKGKTSEKDIALSLARAEFWKAILKDSSITMNFMYARKEFFIKELENHCPRGYSEMGELPIFPVSDATCILIFYLVDSVLKRFSCPTQPHILGEKIKHKIFKYIFSCHRIDPSLQMRFFGWTNAYGIEKTFAGCEISENADEETSADSGIFATDDKVSKEEIEAPSLQICSIFKDITKKTLSIKMIRASDVIFKTYFENKPCHWKQNLVAAPFWKELLKDKNIIDHFNRIKPRSSDQIKKEEHFVRTFTHEIIQCMTFFEDIEMRKALPHSNSFASDIIDRWS